jgi:hypothetical protein
MDMAVDGADFLAGHAGQHHQLEADRHEIFADDMQPRFRQEVMDIGDASGDRVLDRDHRQVRIAVFERLEGVLESRARKRFHGREHVAAGHVGIGAEIALEGDAIGECVHGVIRYEEARANRIARAFSRSAGVSTPNGTESTISASMRMPGFERPQLFERFALFEHGRPERHELFERSAAIGVEPDMVVERPIAVGRGGAGKIERRKPLRKSASRRFSPRSDWSFRVRR